MDVNDPAGGAAFADEPSSEDAQVIADQLQGALRTLKGLLEA